MITLATTLVALEKTGQKLKDQVILFAGAGTAATGIGMLFVRHLMMEFKLTREQALDKIFFIDSKGLVYDRDIIHHKKSHPKRPFLKSCA
jgi:malate dehydrogenase (oxaloacetate-decarboxylating)(NADP+)